MRDGYLAHVDGLRAIAVLVVILFHLDVLNLKVFKVHSYLWLRADIKV